MSLIQAAAEAAEETHELPVHPYVVGILVLVFFLVLLMGLLSFGKGREHT